MTEHPLHEGHEVCEQEAKRELPTCRDFWPSEWCLHCGSETCEHAARHNAAYGREDDPSVQHEGVYE